MSKKINDSSIFQYFFSQKSLILIRTKFHFSFFISHAVYGFHNEQLSEVPAFPLHWYRTWLTLLSHSWKWDLKFNGIRGRNLRDHLEASGLKMSGLHRQIFFPSLPQIGSSVCCAWEKKKKKKNALSNIKDVILLPRRARDKSPPLWALLLLSPLTFIASQIIFPQTCHPSCLSGILPCPHLIKMFSPLFSSLLMVCALRKLCIFFFFTANLCVFRQIFI